MRHSGWILYPEARRKLEESGLMDRISKARKEYKIQTLGHVDEGEVYGWLKEALDKNGLFSSIPKSERQEFMDVLKKTWNEKDKAKWTVKRLNGEYTEEMDPSDFIMLTGLRASDLLPKKEVFSYRKFGFDTLMNFVGSVGAAIEEKVHFTRDGLGWNTNWPDGRIIYNLITGDTHADMRIFQEDLTPYETISPFGYKVDFRPELQNDRGWASPYHSTEGEFLAGVLKYIDQQKLKPRLLENRAQELLEYARSLGQGGGTCAEHFGGNETSPVRFFIGWEKDQLPLIKEGEKTPFSSYSLAAMGGEGGFGMYVDQSGNLVISYVSYKNKEETADLARAITFYPQDMDNVLKGVIYQCARGIGRTPATQLTRILEYRVSDDFGTEDPKILHKWY